MDNHNLSELPPFLTPPSACRLMGIGLNTFYTLVREGKLPGAFRLGKAIRVNTKVLLESLGTKDDTAETSGQAISAGGAVKEGRRDAGALHVGQCQGR